MKIEKIIVRAGRTVAHPLESYGNLRADLEYVASLHPDDDPEAVRRNLQEKIETDVEQHVADLKESIEDFAAATNRKKQIMRLQADLQQANEKLQELQAQDEADDSRPLLKRST